MIIRKISIGPDYKGGAMHYLVGQTVLKSYKIVNILSNEDESRFDIWIQKGNEIFLWKSFNHSMPTSIEYNIDF